MALRVAEDLHQLLHPCDERDIPVPGFPSGDALIAWAHTKPRDAVLEGLKKVLRFDGFPQQIAATAVIRSFGVEIDGERLGTRFVWSLGVPPAPSEQIEPMQPPARSRVGDDVPRSSIPPSVGFRDSFRALNRAFLDLRLPDDERELV